MKIKLSQFTIETNKIKQLYNKPKRLYAGMGKKTKPHYCIEFVDETFTEITKNEYKILKEIIKKENNNDK